MAGIAGINRPGEQKRVRKMLTRLSHRGQGGFKIIEEGNATVGATWSETLKEPISPTMVKEAVWDGAHPPLPDPDSLGHAKDPFALGAPVKDLIFLARDFLGERPLYYGWSEDGSLCFASEVKALLEVTHEVNEVPPGTWSVDGKDFVTYDRPDDISLKDRPSDEIIKSLRLRLEEAVTRRLHQGTIGCWLSGGLDSSAIAALIRPHVAGLPTFCGGIAGAQDLIYARQVAEFLKTDHYEVIVTLEELLEALPDVIYHLESFDALLVRSSLTNYLVAQRAAGDVDTVFSGEGADELFGGYAYLKQLDYSELGVELEAITGKLHNTALQRVDRSASAHGLITHLPFLDREVVRFARAIPPELKVWHNGAVIEKWVLRKAVDDLLPEEVVWRGKAKFWQGAGVANLLAEHANREISDNAFQEGRQLPNGWEINTKEEMFYFRIFKEHFGQADNLDWMGRTRGAPRQN